MQTELCGGEVRMGCGSQSAVVVVVILVWFQPPCSKRAYLMEIAKKQGSAKGAAKKYNYILTTGYGSK